MSEDNKFNFNRIMDGLLDNAKSIADTLSEKSSEFIKESGLKDLKDYYPFYSWPPLNLYSCVDESLIFEFGLPGFIKDDVTISFDEDYMLFSAVLTNKYSTGSAVRSFKKKLKLEDIAQQKYFLPADKFDTMLLDFR